jgi:hypothetical protein
MLLHNGKISFLITFLQTNYILSALAIFVLVTMVNPVPMFLGVVIMAIGEDRS